MIWSDICWNLSCCKLETKRFPVNTNQSKVKANKTVNEKNLIQSYVFNIYPPFAVATFAPVREKKGIQHKRTTILILSFKSKEKVHAINLS